MASDYFLVCQFFIYVDIYYLVIILSAFVSHQRLAIYEPHPHVRYTGGEKSLISLQHNETHAETLSLFISVVCCEMCVKFPRVGR
jgi:hypothetical protein